MKSRWLFGRACNTSWPANERRMIRSLFSALLRKKRSVTFPRNKSSAIVGSRVRGSVREDARLCAPQMGGACLARLRHFGQTHSSRRGRGTKVRNGVKMRKPRNEHNVGRSTHIAGRLARQTGAHERTHAPLSNARMLVRQPIDLRAPFLFSSARPGRHFEAHFESRGAISFSGAPASCIGSDGCWRVKP